MRPTLYAAAMGMAAMAAGFFPSAGLATPSQQVTIPSPDVVPQLGVHLDVDNTTTIFTSRAEGGHSDPVRLGMTVGLLEGSRFGMEAGLDLREQSDHPLSYNFKILIREGAFHYHSPAVAFGMYQMGSPEVRADYNIAYGLAAKSFPAVGRLAAGIYIGSSSRLVDHDGKEDNAGLLLSFDRTLAEIGDRLWFAADYMSGNNVFGALSLGLAYRFALPPGPGLTGLLGYVIYNDQNLAGKNAVTIQFDIDLNQRW